MIIIENDLPHYHNTEFNHFTTTYLENPLYGPDFPSRREISNPSGIGQKNTGSFATNRPGASTALFCGFRRTFADFRPVRLSYRTNDRLLAQKPQGAEN
jgi:hypothetical protein